MSDLILPTTIKIKVHGRADMSDPLNQWTFIRVEYESVKNTHGAEVRIDNNALDNKSLGAALIQLGEAIFHK